MRAPQGEFEQRSTVRHIAQLTECPHGLQVAAYCSVNPSGEETAQPSLLLVLS